jgi:uracil-DNA glycosylase family 4
MTYDKQYAQEHLGADCDNCPLRDTGKFVPSVGPRRADIAFVGEAPGQQEAAQGVPFIGPSGRLLTIVHNQFGIKREEVFLSNAALCRPNDGSSPPKSAILSCRPRLLRELQERGVSTVVALGNSAAFSTLGREGVTTLRVGPGRQSPYEELQGVRIIPTVHPAACLRQSDMFPSLVADVGKVVTDHVVWTDPWYRVFDDPGDAIKVLGELQERASWLVVDIEVDIEKDTSFDHPNRYGMLCVGLSYAPGRAVVIGESALTHDEVRNALADCLRGSKIICHNGKFDLAGLQPICGSLELAFDTMLASYCLDERPGVHGLKYLAVEFLGAPKYDEVIKQYVGTHDGYGVIPRPVLYKYNAYDAACTYSLFVLLSKRLDDADLRQLHDFLVEASNELMFLELNGLPVDREYNMELWHDYEASLGLIERDIDNLLAGSGYRSINPRSPLQVKGALAHFRVSVDSTDEDTLKLIQERTAPETPLHMFVSKMLVQRREQKMFGTYVKGIRKRLYRNRIYPTFMLHGTTTGRLASRNPNVQNIPRESKIKEQFIPGKEDNVFVQADYKQAEARFMTWFAQDEYLREILNDDSRDLFDELTPELYPGITEENTPYELWKDIRVRVKAFFYGLGYGRTWYSISQEYRMPEAEAQAVTERFMALIPATKAWQQSIKKTVYSGQDLITPFGRHRRFHLITNQNWKSIQNEALAFLPQSTSSDTCLRAMVRVRRDLRGSGAFVRNIVHDSILVDAPADVADDVAKLLDHHMVGSAQEVVGDYIKFGTDVKVGQHWGQV